MPQAEVLNQLSDWRWRLNNLYKIVNKKGRQVTFVMNTAQEQFFDELHFLNLILKARQRGFTTFVQIFQLDACIFNDNVAAGTIAHKLDAAKDIFKTKVKYPYDNLPDAIRASRPAKSDTERTLEFNNGSSMRVDTSFRGGTFQFLHVSEFGKICATDPERAKEIVTGAFNTVQAGNYITIESTAEGRSGHYFDMCERAQKHQGPLTEMDWKFFFFPWWEDPDYRLDADVAIPQHLQEYFRELDKQGIRLDSAQKAWYVKKEADQRELMKREYPSTAKEAFEQAIDGAYLARQLNTCRQRKQITKVPHDPAHPVHTFWDLGHSDSTSIWFYQKVGMQHRFFDYYENSGEGLPHYVKILEERGHHNGGEHYNYTSHHLPHDADNETLGAKPIAQQLKGLGINGIRVGDRVRHKETAIEAARTVLPTCWFDEENCVAKSGQQLVGLPSLENYQKQWNPKLGTWRDEPLHNWASHGADAFMEFAMNQKSVSLEQNQPLVYRTGQYA